jgi:hypothetical protein
VVGFGTLGLVLAIWATRPLHEVFAWIPDLHMNLLGAGLIVLFGFLFVTVSSRITGEIGSSSNPISGMTVATLLLTCLIFLLLGWTDPRDRLTALSVAAVVCIAASNGGTTSQDLKTGYLVGATPKYQQLAIVVGALSSALVIGWILIQLNNAYTVYSKKDLPVLPAAKRVNVKELDLPRGHAPDDDTPYYVWHVPEGNTDGIPQGKYLVDEGGQIRYLVDPGINGKRSRRDDGTEVVRFKAPKAQLMSLITDGILRQKLPWALVLLGVSIAIVLELCGVPSLPFAVGVYLPLSSSTPIFAGGLVRYVSDRWGRRSRASANPDAESDSSPGVLLSTGYIAGGAIAGVVIAFLSFSDEIPKQLAFWQYSHYTLPQPMSLGEAAREAAGQRLGRPKGRQALGVQEKASQEAKAQDDPVTPLAKEIEDLNANELPRYARVPAGTRLRLPHNKAYDVQEDSLLGEIARQLMGSPDKAQVLLDLNKDTLRLPDQLPAGTSIKLPQQTAPALIAFGVLVLVLVLVGLGWLFNPPPAARTPLEPHRPGTDDGMLFTGDQVGITQQ